MVNYILLGMILLAASPFGCRRAAQDDATVAARVNGETILRAEVEKQFLYRTNQMPQKPTGTMADLMKLEIVREMISGVIMIQMAQQLKLQISDAEVETELQKLRGSISDADFKKALEERGITEADLRKDLRRGLTAQKLTENQVNSKIKVTDEEVSSFYETNKNAFNAKERQYHIGQILVSSDPSIPVNNSRNDKALNAEQARGKIQMLANRLQAGESFEQLAREFSEDPQTAQSGGDLGYHPASVLEQLGPPMKDALPRMKVGDVSPILGSPDGYRILKLLDKREAGQVELNDPQVQQGIRNELTKRKQELLSSVFSEQLHNEARVENLLAREILGQFQK